MNVNLIRLKGLITEMRGIRHALERMADCWESELNDVGLRPAKVDTSGPEPTITYVDEQMDWARENIDYIRNLEKQAEEEEAR